ncbi:hypothetical protein BKA69DRAFT_220582 [Paraphysoderma sedebokerense]|nr:hypothetical protein BKA69DRAFT_220582 [Paraphysoderma sedebokerense]
MRSSTESISIGVAVDDVVEIPFAITESESLGFDFLCLPVSRNHAQSADPDLNGDNEDGEVSAQAEKLAEDCNALTVGFNWKRIENAQQPFARQTLCIDSDRKLFLQGPFNLTSFCNLIFQVTYSQMIQYLCKHVCLFFILFNLDSFSEYSNRLVGRLSTLHSGRLDSKNAVLRLEAELVYLQKIYLPYENRSITATDQNDFYRV